MDKYYARLAIWGIIGRVILGVGILGLVLFVFIVTKNPYCLWGMLGLYGLQFIPTYSTTSANEHPEEE